MSNNFFSQRYRQSFFKKGQSDSEKINPEKIDTEVKSVKDYKPDLKQQLIEHITTINKFIIETMLLNTYNNQKVIEKIIQESDLNHKEGKQNKNLETLWNEIKSPIINTIKLDLINKKSTEIFQKFEEKINYIVIRYVRQLPQHVGQSESDDLKTIAQLEFIETYKAWQPTDNQDIWPLAYTRITGAMKDHIRYITKSDPSRIYDWINDAAYIYMATEKDNSFEKEIESGLQLNKAMECLNPREKSIVISYTKQDLTFGQIGQEIGVSESQVSRIYKTALKKMKEVLS